MNNLFSCRVSNATVSGSLILNLFRASDTREILPGPCRVVLAIPFMQIIEVALASPPKRSSEYDWVLEFLPNIDVFPGQCGQCGECPPFYKARAIFCQNYKENTAQYHKNDMFCRLLAQTTLRNILGTKNLHEILSDRESISSSMQVVFLYVLVQKVVGQFATNIVKQTTF